MTIKPNRTQSVPVYNIKAVSRLVGLLPVTIRAWERRYGIPQPARGGQGYRIYSEYDVQTLDWLKNQVESGLTIGRAVEYLLDLRAKGLDPINIQTGGSHAYPEPPVQSSSPSLQILSQQFVEALEQINENTAREVLRRAFTIYAIDQVLMEIVRPALVRLGEAWQLGKLPIAVEHYATQFCMQHLLNMMAVASPPSHPGSIVAACAPGEMHQIGLLMLVVMLRWRGWDITYLGPDLPLDRIEEALIPIHPQILMFSATQARTAKKLSGLAAVLSHFPEPHPLVVLGGQAFQQMRLPENVPAVYLNMSPTETVNQIEVLMAQSSAKPERLDEYLFSFQKASREG